METNGQLHLPLYDPN